MIHASEVILQVEDDPNDILLLERAFKKGNLPGGLMAVNDGDSAVAYLNGDDVYANRREYPFPGVVLLDLKLPRRSGLEVLAWVRAHRELKSLPVVILSSSRQPPDIDRAYELGANSYLVKPVGFDALVEMVRTTHQYWFGLNEAPDSPVSHALPVG